MILRKHPWLTESAIEFLEKYLNEHKNINILEFGSGASTLWFSKLTKNLVSLEHKKEWYDLVNKQLASETSCNKVDYRLKDTYYDVCDEFPDNYFDLILIDGKNRNECAIKSMRILKKGGILMLDNAERSKYRVIYEALKDWPINITIQTKPDRYGFFEENWQTVWWIKLED